MQVTPSNITTNSSQFKLIEDKNFLDLVHRKYTKDYNGKRASDFLYINQEIIGYKKAFDYIVFDPEQFFYDIYIVSDSYEKEMQQLLILALNTKPIDCSKKLIDYLNSCNFKCKHCDFDSNAILNSLSADRLNLLNEKIENSVFLPLFDLFHRSIFRDLPTETQKSIISNYFYLNNQAKTTVKNENPNIWKQYYSYCKKSKMEFNKTIALLAYKKYQDNHGTWDFKNGPQIVDLMQRCLSKSPLMLEKSTRKAFIKEVSKDQKVKKPVMKTATIMEAIATASGKR